MRQKTRKKHRKGKRIVLSLLVLILTISAVRFAVNQTAFQDFLHFNTDVASMEHGWNLILVNWEYKIPKDWKVELTELSNGQSVDSRIYPDLQEMFDDARGAGYSLFVRAGYRSEEDQENLMEDKIEAYRQEGYSQWEAEREAEKWVAKPGTSEHELGLSVDINAEGQTDGNRLYQWLAEHSWKYGFILRYPAEKEEITGIDYEPWHFRYVGKQAAKEMYEKDLCLEEYVQ